ncbi:MAG: caspase family protein [Rhodomicrobium sp.]
MIAARYGFILTLIASLFAFPALAENRVALVVGNGNYTGQPHLPNPPHDAEDMAAALQGLGFKVILGTDLDKAGFDAKLHEFSRSTTGADVAFFFYSGHGMQIDGVNYLVPVDAPVTKEDLEFQTVTMDFVQKLLERAKTKIIMLDACRNNPFAAALGDSLGTRAVNANAGLAMTTAPDLGYFIAFATQPGHVASDGQGRNSPFSGSLKTHLGTAGLSISDLMIVVRNDVVQATGGQQIPWDHSALSSRFSFMDGSSPVIAADEASRKASEAAEAWGWVRDTSNPEALQQFMTTYPDSPLVAQAKVKLASLKQAESRSATAQSSAWTPVTLGVNEPVRPAKPSFDCRLHHSDAEVTICNNPELSLLDNQLAALYTRSLRTLSEASRRELVTGQRQWIRAVIGCGTGADCLAAKYRGQIQKLKAPLQTAAAAPAPQIKPSFDCASRHSPAEVAVCNNPDLAQLDQELERLYARSLKTFNFITRQRLLHAQRQWIRNRDTCAGNLSCLKVQYQARIQHLQP